MAEKILIIDDDKDMCLVLKRFLSKHGFEAIEANSGKKALEILEGTNPDLILCDFKLEDMDGTTILKNIKDKLPAVPVIIITGYSNIKTAVEVMRLGAIDYVTKPLLPDEILVTIKRALKEPAPVVTQVAPASTEEYNGSRTQASNGKKGEVNQTYIFGNSPDFKNILNQIDLVGPTNYSVIIYGESGSGKEAIAQEIHNRSKSDDKAFIAIECVALSK